jgi:hypothetical protein
VTISYTLLDTPITSDVDMVKRDGRWYSADAIKNVENMLAKPVGASATPPMETAPSPSMSSEPPASNASSEAPASNASAGSNGDNADSTKDQDQQPTH